MGNTQSVGAVSEREPVLETPEHATADASGLPGSHDSAGISTPQRHTDRRRISSILSTGSDLYNSMRRRATVIGRASGTTTPSAFNIEDTRHGHEDRPLANMDGPEYTEQSSAGGLRRAPSAMSRLGSRLLPDTVMRGLLSSGEETAEEGEALRQGTSWRRRPSVFERRAISTSNDRFSLSGTLRRRTELRAETRRPIRGPFPVGHSDHQRLSNDANQPTDGDHRVEGELESEDTPSDYRRRRLPRFSRVRHSLQRPLSGLFGVSREQHRPHLPRSPTPHPGQEPSSDESMSLLSPLPLLTRRSPDDGLHELDAAEPEVRNVLSTSRITAGMTSIRRFPHGLRSRSTRLIRRGEHPPLSQVLQLAAAAIAAQLSGQASNDGESSRNAGREAFDGSIQNFVQTLQDAASAQAGENVDFDAADGDLPPVNFMRVFQFPNDENGAPIAPSLDRNGSGLNANAGGIESERSVTLVLVGVRSMPNIHDGSSPETGALGPSLDTLLSLPFLPPANILRNGSSGALFRRSDNRTRHVRRHSMTNFSFPAQYESQRHSRTRSGPRTNSAEPTLLMPNHSGLTPNSDSPPGPHPPPSTPADIRSGHATPIRRPSSASAAQPSLLPNLEEDSTVGDQVSGSDFASTTARQRRRSDSEFARRPDLGSGAARRNGVVEPDRAPIGAGRSWLIYVVGTNVSPDHPAFMMPSLFTDNPSYEDMQMLSTLLGPVKPPVATRNDVDSAGGTYRLSRHDGILVAIPHPVAAGEQARIAIADGDRCLICLCDYEPAEEVRRLNSCQHVYHKECIDEWLTTGRNSCPMCRGQGVTENPPTVTE